MWHITLVDPRGPLVGDRFIDSRLLLGTQLEDDSNSYIDEIAFDDIPHSSALAIEWSVNHAHRNEYYRGCVAIYAVGLRISVSCSFTTVDIGFLIFSLTKRCLNA